MSTGKAVIAMSGGVDSSVAAGLVLQAGYEITGITLRLQDENCGSEKDVQDAASVARKLGVPHIVLDYRELFSQKVMEYFADSYRKGETPNPCVECNKYIKFGKLCEDAEKMGFTNVATGHYARTEYDSASGRWLLKKAVNEEKDQSYVLYGLDQKQLSMALFPLGGLTKEEVRHLAEKQGFVNAHKHDSQDICFVPDGDYSGFIERFCGGAFPEGDFTDTTGKVLGRHKGIIHYTIGQRKGLGLAMCVPVYVKTKDVEKNQVVIARDEELYSRNLDARDVNIIISDNFTGKMRVKAKIRYKHKEQWATVTMTGEREAHVEFDEPQRAMAAGQSVVFYDGDIVVGGGIIR